MELVIHNSQSEKEAKELNTVKNEEYKIIREYKNEYTIDEMVDMLIRTHANPS